jgi:hypothetical protein
MCSGGRGIVSRSITIIHFQRCSGSGGRTRNLSNTRGCHRGGLNSSCASKKRGGIRGSKHWLRISHSLPLLLLARFARDNGNLTSRIVKSSDWPSGVSKSFLNAIEMALHRWRKNLGNAFRSLLNDIVLGMALHRWRRRRLGTQPAKNSTFIYASLRLGLRARQLAGSGSSLGTKETSVAKDMAEVAILRQSLVYNFLQQSGPFRQRNLHIMTKFLKEINFHQNSGIGHTA